MDGVGENELMEQSSIDYLSKGKRKLFSCVVHGFRFILKVQKYLIKRKRTEKKLSDHTAFSILL